jgi:hypothetical protein
MQNHCFMDLEFLKALPEAQLSGLAGMRVSTRKTPVLGDGVKEEPF